jgi:hypothetical protein
MNPETLVQRQLEAYNQHDLAAFAATYSEDIELYNFPNSLISKGKPELQRSYGKLFQERPTLHSTVLSRTVQGNFVINKEAVVGLVEGDRVFEVVAVYQVSNDLISKVWFIW